MHAARRAMSALPSKSAALSRHSLACSAWGRAEQERGRLGRGRGIEGKSGRGESAYNAHAASHAALIYVRAPCSAVSNYSQNPTKKLKNNEVLSCLKYYSNCNFECLKK